MDHLYVWFSRIFLLVYRLIRIANSHGKQTFLDASSDSWCLKIASILKITFYLCTWIVLVAFQWRRTWRSKSKAYPADTKITLLDTKIPSLDCQPNSKWYPSIFTWNRVSQLTFSYLCLCYWRVLMWHKVPISNISSLSVRIKFKYSWLSGSLLGCQSCQLVTSGTCLISQSLPFVSQFPWLMVDWNLSLHSPSLVILTTILHQLWIL